MTISSHFPEESVAAPKVTAGSNVLGFLGGIALGFLPVLMVVLMFISPLFTGVYFDSSMSEILLILSGILVVAGSVFAIVKRKYGEMNIRTTIKIGRKPRARPPRNPNTLEPPVTFGTVTDSSGK